MDLQQLTGHYCGAWAEPDEASRERLLEQCWADDGVYCDPTAHVVGRAALIAHIGGFFAQYPGARIEQTSAVDAHHGLLRFSWRMRLADGSVLVEGLDVGELAGDGRLQRIVGFFGPLAP